MALLHEACGDDRLHYELTRELLSVERQQRSQGRRAGLYDRLDKTFRKHFFRDKADATDYARRRLRDKKAAEAGQLALFGADGAADGVAGGEDSQ